MIQYHIPFTEEGLRPAEVEPFTQTWYRSANMSKTFNARSW